MSLSGSAESAQSDVLLKSRLEGPQLCAETAVSHDAQAKIPLPQLCAEASVLQDDHCACESKIPLLSEQGLELRSQVESRGLCADGLKLR